MKILVLHQFFNTPDSGGPLRSYYLVQALRNAGHEVIVITTTNDVSRQEVIDGVNVHYLSIPYDNRFGFYRRIIAFIRFVAGAFLLTRRIKGIDFCYAISAPLTVGVAAKWIKTWYNIPYYFEVGDLWPDAPIQMGFITDPLTKALLYQLERAIYRDSEGVVALSPAIAEAVRAKVPDHRVEVVPNLSDCEFFRPVLRSAGKESHAWEGKLVIAYIGAMGVANGLDYLLESANAARKANLPVHFILCGDGAAAESLQLNAKRLGLLNLTFLPFTNREGVRKIMDTSDAVFICYKNVQILETGSPHKFFDGLAAGKMIILNVHGWMEREVLENRCGISLDPYNPSDFVTKITPVLKDSSLLHQYQESARKLAEKKFSRQLLENKFVALFKA